MKVRFTRPAQQDLDGIYAYISRDSPRAASRIVDRIVERAYRLGDNPFVGRTSDYADVRVAIIPQLRYLIFYALTKDELHVLHIRHAARRQWRGRDGQPLV